MLRLTLVAQPGGVDSGMEDGCTSIPWRMLRTRSSSRSMASSMVVTPAGALAGEHAGDITGRRVPASVTACGDECFRAIALVSSDRGPGAECPGHQWTRDRRPPSAEPASGHTSSRSCGTKRGPAATGWRCSEMLQCSEVWGAVRPGRARRPRRRQVPGVDAARRSLAPSTTLQALPPGVTPSDAAAPVTTELPILSLAGDGEPHDPPSKSDARSPTSSPNARVVVIPAHRQAWRSRR